MMLPAVWKPWYLYQPRQILRRMRGLREAPSTKYEPLRAAWGIEMLACPAEHLGQCLSTTGIYDLAVSELMFRLVRHGDVIIDAGANIGYTTLLAAVAAGAQGKVIAFEPNPRLFPILAKNVDGARRHLAMASVELRQSALGARRYRTALVLADPSAANDGLSYIPGAAIPADRADTVDVDVETLDAVLDGQTAALMKIDVEGHERQVFQGAADAIRSHRIRHIVFEDHEGPASSAAAFLAAAGYRLFSIGWTMRHLMLAPVGVGRKLTQPYEAPSYLATVEPEVALGACRPSGWQALRRQTQWQ
jgi:FkbM family methyltransferase